jgi:hypothetical protein
MRFVARSTDLEWRQIDDEVVMLDTRQGTYLALNGSAGLLWTALAAGASRDELAAILVERYGIEMRQATEDADEFITALAERGLLAA